MTFTPMLGMAGFCLLALMASVMLMFRTSTNQRDLDKRIETLLAPHRQEISFASTRVVRETVQTRPVDRLIRLFGIDRTRSYGTGATPWVIVGIAFVVARLLAYIAGFVAGHVALMSLPLAWIVVSRAVFKWLARRHAEKLRGQMPDALAMIVRSVRVGIPIAEGIRAVGRDLPEPTADLFRQVAGEVAIGIAIEDALYSVTAKEGLQEYRFFATALSLQSRTGGGLSETLENLADVIRKRLAAKARGYALAAEARTSALVLALLPVVALGGLFLMNPPYIMVLFTTHLGNLILGGAIALQAMGIGSMRMLIRKALS